MFLVNEKAGTWICPGGDVPHRWQIYKFYFDSDAREIEARMKSDVSGM
jgi:hypothetical protein